MDLACNSISDPTALTSLPYLETLDISGNKLSSVDVFVTMTGLKELNLSGNNISSDQIERLRFALPGCNIIFE